MQLDEDEFTREPLNQAKPARGGDKRRMVRRTLLAVGGCLLLAIMLLVATGTAGTLWRLAQLAWLAHNTPTLTRATITPQAPGRRALPGDWQRQPQIKLPTPTTYWYTPMPDDPNSLYSCSASRATSPTGIEVGPLTFWYSHDIGQHWSSVRLPATKDTYCNVAVAPDNPQRLLLQGQLYSGCTNIDAFLSSDGGAHWYAVPTLPDAPAPDNRCGLSFWLSAHHLFLSYGFTTYSGPPQNQTAAYHSSLWRSDDGGHSWKNLDANRPAEDGDYYTPMLLNDGETLLVSMPNVTPAANGRPEHDATSVWVSHDAGDSWEPWGDIQGLLIGRMLLTPGARSLEPTPARPLYLLSGVSGRSRSFRIQIAQAPDMRHWAPLPPLPIKGASPDRLGITTALTETTSGKLLVFGLGPDDTIPADETQLSTVAQPARQWLWEWDPQASRWTLLTPALDFPWPESCSDTCWHGWLAPSRDSGHAGTNLWVSAFFGVETPHWTTFHIRLPNPI